MNSYKNGTKSEKNYCFARHLNTNASSQFLQASLESNWKRWLRGAAIMWSAGQLITKMYSGVYFLPGLIARGYPIIAHDLIYNKINSDYQPCQVVKRLKKSTFREPSSSSSSGCWCRISTPRTKTELVLQTSVFSPFNQLTRLVVRDNFIILSRRESFRSYMTSFVYNMIKFQTGTLMSWWKLFNSQLLQSRFRLGCWSFWDVSVKWMFYIWYLT
jgi:hypothetical protein